MVIIVMMVLTISIISMNVSMVMRTEGEVKRLQGEILALGAIAYTYANQMSGSPGSLINYIVTLDNVDFNVVVTLTDDNTGPNGTDPVNVEVWY